MSLCLSTQPHRETFSPTEDMFKEPHKVVRVGQERREETCLAEEEEEEEEGSSPPASAAAEEEEEEEEAIALL